MHTTITVSTIHKFYYCSCQAIDSRIGIVTSTDQQLVEKLSKKYLHPEQALKYCIEQKMRRGKTREQAIKEIEQENT